MILAGVLAGQFEQDCTRCVHSAELRTKWGCDADLPRPIAFYRCPRCLGTDPGCDLCSAEEPTGSLPIVRCPNVLLRDVRWIGPFKRAFAAYKAGFLPAEGGFLDQSAWFVEAVTLVDSEISRANEDMRNVAEMKAAAKAALKQGNGRKWRGSPGN